MTDLSEFAKHEPHRPTKVRMGSIVVEGDEGEIDTGELQRPIEMAKDWEKILESFGLDPTIFFVVDDTVRMSKWQTSKRTEDGDRDVVWLYSYKARFARRAPGVEPIDLARLQAKIDKWKPRKRKHGASDEPPCTFVVGWADWQIGKSAGGGVESAVERIQSDLEDTVDRIADLRRAGRNIEKIAVFNMGDPGEGCDGNYASQRATVELNQRAQLNLILDLWEKGIEILDPDIFLSVLCNHGEWTRNGGSKPVTSDSDNVGGFLGDTIRRQFRDKGPSEWYIAHDEFVQMVNLSGVEVGVTHGHKIVGKEFEWLRGQGQRLQFETGRMPRVWVTAHVHHGAVEDFGPFWRIQCPSNDGGSKWFTDRTGKWSTPGTMTFLAGTHDARGWSDMEIL